MLRVNFHREALLELDEAFDWYAKQSTSAARRFWIAVHEAAEKAARQPTLYAMFNGIHRSCPVTRFPYRLFFFVEEDLLTVVAVAHNSRRPDFWEDRI